MTLDTFSHGSAQMFQDFVVHIKRLTEAKYFSVRRTEDPSIHSNERYMYVQVHFVNAHANYSLILTSKV